MDRSWTQMMSGTLVHIEDTLTEEWTTGALRIEMRGWIRSGAGGDGSAEFTCRTMVFKPTAKGQKTEAQMSEVRCAREESDEPFQCSAREFWTHVQGGLMGKMWDGPKSGRPPSGWKSETDLDGDELLQVASRMPELPPGFLSPPIWKPTVHMRGDFLNQQ